MPVAINATPNPIYKRTNVLIGLATFIILTPCVNYLLVAKLFATNADVQTRLRKMESLSPRSREAYRLHHKDALSLPLLVKASSINSYWWPSAEEGGGKNNYFALTSFPR